MNSRVRLAGVILHAPTKDDTHAAEIPPPGTLADGDATARFRQLLARRGAAQRVDQDLPEEHEASDAKDAIGGTAPRETPAIAIEGNERRPGRASDADTNASAESDAHEMHPWMQSDARERMMAAADASPAMTGVPHHRHASARAQVRRAGVSGARAATAQTPDEPDDGARPSVETPKVLSVTPASALPFEHADDAPERIDAAPPAGTAARVMQRHPALALPAIVDTVAQALTTHSAGSAGRVSPGSSAAPREIVLTLDPSVLPDTRLQLQLSGSALSLRFETQHRQSVALLSDQAADLAQRVFRRTGRAVTVSLNGDALAGSHRTVS